MPWPHLTLSIDCQWDEVQASAAANQGVPDTLEI